MTPTPPDVDAPPPRASRALNQLASLPPAIQLAGGLAIFLVLSVVAMTGESMTVDELVHLPAGYASVIRSDHRLNSEHPPLSKTWAALPLLFQKVTWPDAGEAWASRAQDVFGYRFFYQSGNDPDRLLGWARGFMLFWSCLLLSSVFAVSRELYGPRGGLISLTLATFCPTILAHGHLVTTDIVLATLYLLTLAAFRRLLEKPDLRTSVPCGILLGGILCTKFVAVVILPALGLIVLLRGVRSRGNAAADRTAVQSEHGWTTGLSSGAIVLVTCLAVIWGMYGFRFAAEPDSSPRSSSAGSESFPESLARSARDHRLLPRAFIDGFMDQVVHSAQGHPAFAFGKYSQKGWWWYFPAAFLVKTPVASLLLMGWGVALAIRRAFRGPDREDFLLVPLCLYGVLALAGSINIGVRLILPVVPLMIVLAGGGEEASLAVSALRWRERVLPWLLPAAAAGTVLAAPYYLAFFNLPSRLFFERREMLVDSNLDWGQDLARLKKYMDRQGISEIKLSYFGSGSPRHLQLRHRKLPGFNFYSRFEPEWERADGINPGDIVAVSVMNRSGVLSGPDREYYARALGSLKPVATIGHSILVYRIPPP